LLLLPGKNASAQVITNESAAIYLTPGIVVGSKDLINNGVGDLGNNGTINLSRDFTSVANTWGDGLYRIGGNWTNNCISFVPGSSTVVFNGAANQSIIRSGGETFHSLSISNTGIAPTNRVNISNDVTVAGTLSMSTGNVNASTFTFYLSNQAAASLNYTSVTGSRIFGKFERGINQNSTYLFPLGTIRYYNPANLKINSIISAGSVLSHFDTLPAPGNAGLPIPDPPVEIAETYPDAFWSLTPKNTFSSNDFNINLNATGFIDTIWSTTRVVKRTSGGPWTVDGTHQIVDTIRNVVYRNNLTGNLAPTGTEFALGRAHPLITRHPRDTIVCEHANPVFSVIATGAGRLTYRWYKNGVIITNGPGYTGNRSATLTVNDVDLSDAGTYYCIVSDRYRNKTTSLSATLIVNKIPVATVSVAMQPHECSNIAFDNIVLGESYIVPGTTYIWTRNDDPDIVTLIPLSGTVPNIGDVLGGSFTNTGLAPITITFNIIPIGPAPTFCVGLPIQSTVVVNPTPRVFPVNTKPEMCFAGTTNITLTTPSTMTQGAITFDYTVFLTGTPGQLTGDIAPKVNLVPGHKIVYQYWNYSDTMRSVYYTITPRNNSLPGCVYDSIRVPEVKVHPRPMQSVSVTTPFTCEGGSAGVITTILSRNSKPDQIRWIRTFQPDTTYTTYANSDNLNVHFAGFNYRVTVTDAFGCSNTSSTVPVNGAEFNTTFIQKEYPDSLFGTYCRGDANGEISVFEETSTTAIPPYLFWIVRNGLDTVAIDTLHGIGEGFKKVITSLESGRYQLFIKDANGCYNGDYPAVDIIDPDPITVEFEKFEYQGGYNISCRNYSDGTVYIKTITGGNGGYIYKWTKDGGTISGPDNLSTLTGISAGKYYLLTTDAHNCTKLDSVTLTQPEGISLSSLVPSLYDGGFNISCAGFNDGSIKLTLAGGSGNYNYLWSNGATTKDIIDLVAGTYTATVTDQANNACLLMPQPTFTLVEPDTLKISAVLSLSVDGTNNINCYNGTGSVDITITGGSPDYTYIWSTNNGSGLVPGLEDQSALTAGTYHLLVMDANDCQEEIDITLTEPPALGTLLVPTHITCASPLYNDGSVELTVSGGIAPYSYSWSNFASSEDITGLIQGYYKVTVTDVNGCQHIDSIRVNLPPPVEYISVPSGYNGYNVSCNGLSNGSIDIIPTSGKAPYIFNWQKIGDPFTAATEDISGLGAGLYSLLITDDNLCIATDTIEITEPGELDINFVLSHSTAGEYEINCAGTNTGSIDVVPVNHVGSVSYIWSDGTSTQNRQNLFAGDYSLIIKDSNNCLADSTVTLREPDSLKLELSVSPPWCSDKPDGSISLTVSGGVIGTDYTYKWSDNSTNRDITDIVGGMYRVTVTDLNGCSIKDSVLVEPQQETCLIIPNAISPNGDDINDVWNIGLKELYPNIEIKIFNRWGKLIWRSEKGYPQPWDGRSNGKALPIDSYHYIIDYNNNRKPLIGNVTIVR
jgi:gliding motility-associated-like protein